MSRPIPASLDDVLLSSSTTVKRYHELEETENKGRKQIAKFVYERFRERYLDPALTAKTKSGFALMAINCLMIESLASFRQGMTHTRGKLSEAAFCFFFDHEVAFADFRGHAHDFYVNVRCGILHQAETTDGWLIHLNKDKFLFDAKRKIVNAKEFTQRLIGCLENYCAELESANWDEEIWVNFRKKMQAIIKNCEPNRMGVEI